MYVPDLQVWKIASLKDGGVMITSFSVYNWFKGMKD